MGTLIQLTLLTLVVGLASSKFAIPEYHNKIERCSTECTNGIINGDVTFTEDVKYSYIFKGKTTIIAPTGTSEGESEVSITGLANIIGTKKCGAILYLKHVQLTQGSKTYTDVQLQGYPVLFSFNNGKVGQQICSASRDSASSINLKRAILSTLQVSSVQEGQKDLFETDIQGTCNTIYSSTSSGTILKITKKKDLTQCSGHDKINLFGLSPSKSNMVYETSPFSIATYKSNMHIVNSIIRSVNSEETLYYQPFGPIDVVTKIIVSMNLNLKKRSPTNPLPSLHLNEAKSIVFEKLTSLVESTNANELITATQLAMKSLEPVVGIDGAKLYANLQSLLKLANKEDILNAFEQIKSNRFDNSEMTQKAFINALLAANSGESIEAVAQLLENNELSNSLAASWFNNLANAKYPTKESLVSVSNLLNQRGLKDGYIGVGSLVRNYIKETQDTKSPEIEKALNNLGAPLKQAHDAFLSSDNEDKVLASLKGIGNAQYISNDVADQIAKIIMDKSVKLRIRTSALFLGKSYAENPKIEKACENILTDKSEDSELRLLAFKAFVINPSNYKATIIKSILDDKKCQLQIQAYLLSYLRNLQTTVDENKLEQKKFYGGIQSKSPKKSFSDILRYSQNLEYSYQNPFLHSGILLSGDIIYSHDSFLARSSSVSTSALIFGRQHHVFDIETRIQNIEPLLEKLFGPEGYIAKYKGNPLDDIKNYVNQAVMYVKNRKLNNVDSIISVGKSCEQISDVDLKNIYIDIVFKVFGKDLGWFSFQGHECQINYQQVIDAILKNFDNTIPDEKYVELNIRKQIPIVDYEKKYATYSGLPVSLKIHATSAFKMNLATKFDLESYFKNPENSNFALKFIPSGSLTLDTLLTVDGHIVEVGNKISSSLHTSTGLDYSVESVEGRSFKLIHELPLDVMDVFSAKSEAFSIFKEKGDPVIETLIMNPKIKRQTYTKTIDNLKNTLGLSFSGEYNFPWNGEFKSLLPFSGPISFSLKVLKKDKNLTKYVVKGKYDFNKLSNIKYIKFIYVTPGADINRGIEFTMAYETQNNDKFIMNFKTPSTLIVLQSALINSDLKKLIEIKFKNNDREHMFKFGFKGEVMDKYTTKYIPIYEAMYAKQYEEEIEKNPNINIEGYIIVKQNVDTNSIAKRSMDSQSENVIKSKTLLYDVAAITNKGKHSISGSLMLQNNKIEVHHSLNTDRVNFKYYGYFSRNNPIYKLVSTLNMIKNKPDVKELQFDNSDVYQPVSKLVKLLYKVKTLNIASDYELHIGSPYVYKITNRIDWDKKDHLELNVDILIKDGELKMFGNVVTTNLLDLVLNANITILPNTLNSKKFIFGQLEHSVISDPLNNGHGYFKYVQDLDKKGSSFTFISRSPKYTGTFDFITQHYLTNEGFKYGLYYDVHNGGPLLQVNMSTLTNDFQFDADFKSPNPEYKSSVNFHGWLNKENAYLFNTKLVWPSTHKSNYFNSMGKLFLNGYLFDFSGNVDFPLANLENVQVSFNSMANPEIDDGCIATVRCFSKNQIYLSEKFKYKLTLNNGQLHVSGENIPKGLLKILPAKFYIDFKNYKDPLSNMGKEFKFGVEMNHNGKRFEYKRLMQITNGMFIYRQLYKINDEEQKIELDLEYSVTDARNWSYNLKSKVISPSVFHYLLRDGQNLLEFNSNFILTKNSCEQGHLLKIYSSDQLDDSYELRFFLNNKKKAIQIKFGDREIRNIAHYNFEPMNKGYKYNYSGRLWLDYIRDSNTESTLKLDSYYSFENGLSSEINLKMFIPPLQDKEISVKNSIQMFQSWENLLDVELDLDIYPTSEQALNLQSSLKRSITNKGVLYSAELNAKSDGMELDYSVQESIYISKELWGKYLDIYFVDSDNNKIPIQLHSKLIPGGFKNKINIFDISVIDIDSTFKVEDGVLNTGLNINYNDNPYTFNLLLNTKPGLNIDFGWNDKRGLPEKLKLEGSIVMDDAVSLNAKHVINNNQVIPMGSIEKSLQQSNWWDTDNQMNLIQWNLIWNSLKSKFIRQFIEINNNLRNIISTVKNQRKLHIYNLKRSKPQTRKLKKYTRDEYNKLLNDIYADDYVLQIPDLILNTSKIVLVNFMENIEPVDISYKDLGGNIKDLNVYPKKVYNYWTQNIENLLHQLAVGFDKLESDGHLAMIDLYNILYMNSNKYIKGIPSSEPRSLKEYYNNVIDKLKKKIAELKDTIDALHNVSAEYIDKNVPINNMFHDEIAKLKSYPYKEKIWNGIHKYLKELKATAPTREFASFINAVDEYINKVLHDIPVNEKDIINLRNKGIIVAKSLIVDFSNYVDYKKAMSVYDALCELIDFGKNVLRVISPSSFPKSDNTPNLWYDFSKNAQLYHKYLKPSNLLPPFKGQGVIMDSTNIITFNNQYYSFNPSTATYILAKENKNNKFSIFANYNNNILTSILVSINKDESYELNSGGTATVNGNSLNFPFINDNVKIWKDIYFFGIDAGVGFNIKCTMQLDSIKIFINGYHYGNVFGLLGTLYQEPTFDFKLPNGQISNNMKSFLKEYKVLGYPYPTVNDLVSTQQLPCPSLFSGVSSLKSCFPILSPTAYRSACNQMVSTKLKHDRVDKACLVAKTYVSMARENFATDCIIPDLCKTSTVNNHLLGPSSSVDISEKSDAADIMILFEEIAGNQNVFSVILKPFVANINRYFNKEEINNINFIFIGYSGKPEDSEVHIYSANKENNYEEILDNIHKWSEINAEKNTGLSSQFIESYKKIIGKNSKDKAYKLAGEYPFRPNAVKAVLAIAQTVYTTDSTIDVSQYTFDFITSCFVEQGIKFHLVAPINLQDSLNQDIFGTNGVDTVYTLNHPRGTNSNQEYTFDKSLETDLVIKTNGIMFDSDKFITDQNYKKIIYLNTLCKEIANYAIKDSDVTKSCTSSVHDGIIPYAKCSVVASNNPSEFQIDNFLD